jgi:hypothetical protein
MQASRRPGVTFALGRTKPTGCGAAWLARLSGGQEVPGSNPGTPTDRAKNVDQHPKTGTKRVQNAPGFGRFEAPHSNPPGSAPAGLPERNRSSLDSLEGCKCKPGPTYYTFKRDRTGKTTKGPRVRDRQVAERALRKLLVEVDEERAGVGARRREARSFDAWAEEHLESLEQDRRVKSSTIHSYCSCQAADADHPRTVQAASVRVQPFGRGHFGFRRPIPVIPRKSRDRDPTQLDADRSEHQPNAATGRRAPRRGGSVLAWAMASDERPLLGRGCLLMPHR